MKFEKLLVIALIILLSGTGTFAAASVDQYQFISPMPGSENNTQESTIIIREGSEISPATLISDDVISVQGTQSGSIAGELILSTDGRTIIFEPDHSFAPGERVDVIISKGISTTTGRSIEPAQFYFNIAPFSSTPNPYEYLKELRPDYRGDDILLSKSSADTIPHDFPPVKVEMYDSTALADGYIFMAVGSDYPGVGYYLMMLNNDGTPYFARELEDDYAYDFKVQPNGLLSYAQFLEHHSYTGGGNVIHMIMDNSFTIIDSVQMKNGYIAEAHDFQILPNGHFLLFGYYLTPVDMSQYVDGGYPAALVSGGVIQEMDADKNVIFQWRTWDHYDFAEYAWGRRSTGEVISAFHLNTISLDFDGHILVASPSQNWKINRQTGEIIWKLGGDENEFTFIGVSQEDGISNITGHTFYRTPEGTVMNYDNGNRPGTKTSQVHEFILDEENKTAELAWSYIPDEKIAGWHRGSAQRLPNGNTAIGWGGSSGKYSPAYTEVNAAGEKLLEIFFEPPAIESYRAFRFPFPDGSPSAAVVIIEVAPGNSYDFSEGDSLDTGVQIKVNSLAGDGYNELVVSKYEYAPSDPVFFGKAPIVLPKRATLTEYQINAIDADISFDTAKWGVKHPDGAIVYHRQYEGSGLFLPLPTTYNHVTDMIVAKTTMFGEFIIANPDLESIVFTPMPFDPPDSGTVNQELPVTLQWNPIGFANEFSLQLSKSPDFVQLNVDMQNMKDAFYTLYDLDENDTFFWRVKALNEAGESDWTKPQMFSTVAPFIALGSPNGGEQWQRGLEYIIRWDDNVDEQVVLQLHKGGAMTAVIDTVDSKGAYKWEIAPGLEPGLDYTVQIKSVLNGELFDVSDAVFMVIDTTGTSVDQSMPVMSDYALHQNYPNPFNPVTQIVFELPRDGHVTLKVYDMLGQEVATLIDAAQEAGSHRVTFDGSDLSSGLYFYKFEAAGFLKTGKMILIK